MEPTYDELKARNAELERQVAAALARIAELERLLEQRTRDGKRQAAPFSKGPPKQQPDTPGRKPGKDYGTQACRSVPDRPPDEIIDVPLPDRCECGGRVHEDHVAHQFQEELPRQPIVRRFDIHIGACQQCGRRIQPRHELQTSDALGAAASQLGPDAQATIALMKNQIGMSYGDIQELMGEAFGISVTRGAAAHIVQRAAERTEPFYQAIKTIVPLSACVCPDETGWKLNGQLHWLWVFVTKLVTLVCIRPSRGYDVVAEVLGPGFAGHLVHDGWSVYDRLEQATHQQCLRHLLTRAEELLEQTRGRARRFLKQVIKVLNDALSLRDRREAGTISDRGLAVARGRLEKRLDALLKMRLSHAANRRFQKHLARHHDEVFTFLYHPGLDATNWRGEQAIRPAVVNRKVCGGNRTPAGAHALEVLASAFATCRKNAINCLDALSRFLRTKPISINA